MFNFDYTRAATQKTATDAVMKDNKAKFIAGGTNLVDLMKRGVEMPEKLIDITKVPLNKIERTGDVIRIGALVSNTALAEDELIIKMYPLLAKALNAGASAQLRNMATVGGNMMQRTRCPYFYDTALPCNKRSPGSGCGAVEGYNRMHAIFGASPSCIAVHPSDMCVGMAAMDPTVVINSSRGERKIKFTDFHRLPGNKPEQDNNLQPGEMITAIELPFNDRFSKNTAYVKVRDRNSYAFALISSAVALKMNGNKIEEARIALGGVAHKPWRCTEAEKYLEGKEANINNFKSAAELAMKGATAYEHNKFKLRLAPNTITNALMLATNK